MKPQTRRTRWTAAGFALCAVLGLGACSEDTNDVTNPPVDEASTTPPEEGDNSGEEDQGGEIDDN
jgi:hypothetical protein